MSGITTHYTTQKYHKDKITGKSLIYIKRQDLWTINTLWDIHNKNSQSLFSIIYIFLEHLYLE